MTINSSRSESSKLFDLTGLTGAVKENFTKLQNLLKRGGALYEDWGVLPAFVENLNEGGDEIELVWARHNKIVVVAFPKIATLGKPNATNPTLGTPLPDFLRPRVEVNHAWYNNQQGFFPVGFTYIDVDGNVTFDLMTTYNTSSMEMLAHTVTYIGV